MTHPQQDEKGKDYSKSAQILDPCPEAVELLRVINALKHYSSWQLYLEISTLGIAKRELDALIRQTVRNVA